MILENSNKKKKSKWWVRVWVALILLPLWMWLAWFITPKRKLVVAIVDKTSFANKGQEHRSLIWILNHDRFSLTKHELYHVSRDYYGFFPMKAERFRIEGLERFSGDQLKQLSSDCDLTYYTDTYGVYGNEWYLNRTAIPKPALLYGGMSQQDVDFLSYMKGRRKLIIAEFNDIAPPTQADIRDQFESLFGIRWTGWTGRYFVSFDTAKNKKLPHWLVQNYIKQHSGKWPFHKSGIAFVSLNDEVVVLEDSTDLSNPIPHILTFIYGQKKWGLPKKIKYNNWFDIIDITDTSNHAISAYDISANKEGMQQLNKYNIPARFPAVIMHDNNSYPFYYFCGDFSNNPVEIATSYFKGISFFRWLMYNTDNPEERKSFFWNFYKPLVSHILNDYYHRIHSSE